MPPEPSFHPRNREDWRAWLLENHTRTTGLWVISWRVDAVRRDPNRIRVTYEDLVEEALCFGWIDSKPGKVDDDRTRLWLAPRQDKSAWSLPNKLRVERLIAAGLMHPAGLAKIATAQANGNWTKLDAVEALEIPPDLAAALATYPHAEENFAAFPRSAKRGILEWIIQAKRPETRAKRIAETARLAELNQRAHQWSPPGRDS